MKFWAVIILIAIISVSCKKKTETYTVSGMVSDISDGHAVSGLTVEIQAKLIGTSVYQSSFSTLASGTTDANGNFSITFNKEKATVFRIRTSGINYFTTEHDFSPDLLENGNYTQNVQVAAYGWINLRVINQLPSDPSDEITIKYYNIPAGLVSPCSSELFYFEGLADDTIPSCFVPGGFRLIIEKNIHIGTNYFHSFDTVQIPVNDTLVHYIQF